MYGTNEVGRTYIKSVMKRMIDEKLLNEENLSSVILQIYKNIYGAENVERIIENQKR